MYAEHRALRARLRRERPDLIDLGELDLYASLAPSFVPIEASNDPAARHRCHVAERYLDYLGLPPDAAGRAHVTHGIRRSLGALFALLAQRGATVAIPDDVYPVYLQLAEGATTRRYPSREGIPSEGDHTALLVCDPQKPWGNEVDLEGARRWARHDPNRMLILDTAYAVPARDAVGLEDDAVVLTSLSKGWLLPDHVGLCLAPPRWREVTRAALAALPSDERKLRVGFSALTTEADRPLAVARHLAERASELDALTAAHPELKAGPCRGYLAIAREPFEALVASGVLAIPAPVFGGPATHSVLSSLAPASLHSA